MSIARRFPESSPTSLTSRGNFWSPAANWPRRRIEQNIITIRAEDGTKVVFKQIAGLIARRIVCTKNVGDFVQAGERVGLIKFGSRVDVIFGPEWRIEVSPGSRVSAGTSVLARRAGEVELAYATRGQYRGGRTLPDIDQASKEQASSEAIQRKRPPRAAYALPTLFTAGNIFLGFLFDHPLDSRRDAFRDRPEPGGGKISKSRQRRSGWRRASDWLDGGIARLTNTTSEFGRELDSLADIISFGIAPGDSRLHVGRAVRQQLVGPSCSGSVPRAGHIFRIPVSGMRSGAAGAIQHLRRIRSRGIRASPIGNISWGCRFRRRRA